MPLQIDSRLHCKMCQCTVYTILTVKLLHYQHIGTCTYFTLDPLYRFGPLGPPALPVLTMASYATGSKAPRTRPGRACLQNVF